MLIARTPSPGFGLSLFSLVLANGNMKCFIIFTFIYLVVFARFFLLFSLLLLLLFLVWLGVSHVLHCQFASFFLLAIFVVYLPIKLSF